MLVPGLKIIKTRAACAVRWSMAVSDCLKPLNWDTDLDSLAKSEQFWNVLQPYFAVLCYATKRLPLIDTNTDFFFLDPKNERHEKRCIRSVHEAVWKGKYSLGVADIKAAKIFLHRAILKEVLIRTKTSVQSSTWWLQQSKRSRYFVHNTWGGEAGNRHTSSLFNKSNVV